MHNIRSSTNFTVAQAPKELNITSYKTRKPPLTQGTTEYLGSECRSCAAPGNLEIHFVGVQRSICILHIEINIRSRKSIYIVVRSTLPIAGCSKLQKFPADLLTLIYHATFTLPPTVVFLTTLEVTLVTFTLPPVPSATLTLPPGLVPTLTLPPGRTGATLTAPPVPDRLGGLLTLPPTGGGGGGG